MTTIASALTRRLTALPRITLGTILARIVEADRLYSDSRHAETLSDRQLTDVGLWRAPEHLIRKQR